MWALVINPVAGQGKGTTVGTYVAGWLTQRKIPYTLLTGPSSTSLADQLGNFLEKSSDCDGVIAVGGDGLLHLVLQKVVPAQGVGGAVEGVAGGGAGGPAADPGDGDAGLLLGLVCGGAEVGGGHDRLEGEERRVGAVEPRGPGIAADRRQAARPAGRQQGARRPAQTGHRRRQLPDRQPARRPETA